MDDRKADSRPSNPYLAPPPVRPDVGIVVALPIEIGYFLDALQRVRTYKTRAGTITEGEVAGKIVAVILSGIGRERATRAAEVLIAGHRPDLLISAGFAGALDSAIARNAILAPVEIVDAEGGRYPVTPERDVRSIGGIEATPARLLTVDRIIRTREEKDELGRKHEAQLVDMESAAVAAVCQARQVPFVSVRVVSDDAQSDLPEEVANLMTRSGSYRVGAAVRAIWNRPSSLKDFWTLHARAQDAADRLARALIPIIASDRTQSPA
jgi:adenosylhomocysteine nucleosidase